MFHGQIFNGPARSAVASAMFLLAFLLPVSAARAQEPPSIDGGGSPIRPPTRGESFEAREVAPPIEHRSVLRDLGALVPRFDEGEILLGLSSPDPGPVVYQYRGLQGVAVRRLLGLYRTLARDMLRDRWNRSSDTIFDLERRMGSLAAAEADWRAGGSFLERSWRQSLVPARGGPPLEPRVELHGSEVEVFRVGEAAYTTEGRLRLGRLALIFDDGRTYERRASRDLARLGNLVDVQLGRVGGSRGSERSPLERPIAAASDAFDDPRIQVRFVLAADDARLDCERALAGTARARCDRKTPRGNLFTGDGWNLNATPTLQVRWPGARLVSLLGSIAFEVELGLFPGERRALFATLSLKVRARPARGDVSATLDLEVAKW